MPTYSYKCKDCGHEFEKFLKIAEREKPTNNPCLECGLMTVEMQVGAPAYTGENLKVDGGFKELMKEMKKNVYGNNLPDYS